MIGRRRAPSLRGRRIVVHTSLPDDQSIKGVQIGDYVDVLILEDAVLLLPGGNEQAIRGRARILREKVSWIEEL